MLWSVVLAACLASTTLAQRRKESCESGTCLLVKDCPPVLSVLENAKRNHSLQTHLRSLMCGFEKDHPKVCCPINNIEKRRGEDIALPLKPNCGLSDNIDFERIIGGSPAKLGQWPWMSALGYIRMGRNSTVMSWLCGGALITERHVLTAAHCLSNSQYVLEKVRLGDLDLNDSIEDGATPIDMFIEKEIPHEEYDEASNDIAIIKLDRPVNLTRLIQPICLPTIPELRTNKFERKSPFVIGWGNVEFRGSRVTHLNQVQIEVVNNTLCDDIFKKFNKTITSSHICAGTLTGGKDACAGDSGGPLMMPKGLNFYQIGIVSFGYKCGEVGYPGVYTRTTEYIDWISNKIKI